MKETEKQEFEPYSLCPLLSIAKHGVMVCAEEGCAWWCDSQCAISKIVSALGDIDYEISKNR